MKKCLLVAMVALFVVGLAGAAAFAQETQTKAGTVAAVDAKAKTITVNIDGGRPLTFTATDATKILQGDKAIALGDIKAGAKVSVDYKKDGEKRVASKITVTAEAKAEPKK